VHDKSEIRGPRPSGSPRSGKEDVIPEETEKEFGGRKTIDEV